MTSEGGMAMFESFGARYCLGTSAQQLCRKWQLHLSTDSVDSTVDNSIVRTADRVQVRISYACSNFWQGPGQRLLTVEVLADLREQHPCPRPILKTPLAQHGYPRYSRSTLWVCFRSDCQQYHTTAVSLPARHIQRSFSAGKCAGATSAGTAS